MLPYVDNFFVFYGNGMLESMLEPHLRSGAGATQAEVAATFFILGGSFMIASPLSGYVSLFIPLFSLGKYFHMIKADS